MADLRTKRLDTFPHFSYTVKDVFGKIPKIRPVRNPNNTACYLPVQAVEINLEMLDISIDVFLNTLRYFIAIRGNMRQIVCAMNEEGPNG